MGIPILVRRHHQIQRAPLVWCLTGGKLQANSIKYICTTFIQLSTRYPFAYVLWWGSRPRLWNMTLKSTYYKNVLYHSLLINQPHPDYPCNLAVRLSQWRRTKWVLFFCWLSHWTCTKSCRNARPLTFVHSKALAEYQLISRPWQSILSSWLVREPVHCIRVALPLPTTLRQKFVSCMRPV